MPSALRFLEGRPVAPWRVAALKASLAAAGLALFAATWKLWMPQEVYPQVPLMVWAGRLPPVLEWMAFVAVIVSLVAVLLAANIKLFQRIRSAGASPSQFAVINRLEVTALFTLAGATSLLFLVDQHRLQPWAFQVLVFAIVLASLPARRAFVLLRWLTVSIYFWSAVAKCDHSFLNTQGPQFLGAVLELLGMSLTDLSPSARASWSWLFPLAELFIAVGLCLPLQRSAALRWAVLSFVVAMHLLLIVALSPLGLNHELGVLLWNAWFIAQALLLFGGGASRTSESTDAAQAHSDQPSPWLLRELGEVAVEFFVAAVILLPALNLIGRYDHWPAWGLYAPRNSRAALCISANHADRLPEEIRRHLTQPTGESEWSRLRLNEWSLDALSAPVYPEARFQLGVAEAVVQKYDLGGTFHVIVEAPPDRRTGRRSQTVITDLTALEKAQDEFLLNARPRASK